MPTGVILHHYDPHEAIVDVWCSGLLGLTGGADKTIAPRTNWITMTLTLDWTDDGWRLAEFSQKEGPEPTDAGVDFGAAPQL
ncbi:hypothetical protein ACWCYL_42670 [Streptomyces sp. 900105755]